MRATNAEKLPFPNLPGANNADPCLFWLCAWFRDQAQCTAFNDHYWARLKSRRSGKIGPLIGAMGIANLLLKDTARESLKNLQEEGGLLFAWYGTTALQLLQQAQHEAVPA